MIEDVVVERFRESDDTEYDLFIGAIGYESRATHALARLAGRVTNVVSAPFEQNQVLFHQSNYKLFSSVGEVISGGDLYRVELSNYLETVRSGITVRQRMDQSPLTVCVDVSSMNRVRLAQTMLSLYRDYPAPIIVDWVYSPARFTAGLLENGPVQVNDAIPGFEGWGDPRLPLTAVVGAGLEGDLVLGVLDELEASATIIFEPFGFQKKYDEQILRANRDLIVANSPSRHRRYDVTQPYASFLKLSASVSAASASSRVVLLPLGPKIFAVMCMLIAVSDSGNVTVWRLSADSLMKPQDRVAVGPLLGLRAVKVYENMTPGESDTQLPRIPIRGLLLT